MKSSTVLLILTIVIALATISLFVRNETYTPRGVSEISDYTGGGSVFINEGLPSTIEMYRSNKRNKILLIGGGMLIE